MTKDRSKTNKEHRDRKRKKSLELILIQLKNPVITSDVPSEYL